MVKTYQFQCFHVDEDDFESTVKCTQILNSYGAQGYRLVSLTEHKNVRMGHLPNGVHIVMQKEDGI